MRGRICGRNGLIKPLAYNALALHQYRAHRYFTLALGMRRQRQRPPHKFFIGSRPGGI